MALEQKSESPPLAGCSRWRPPAIDIPASVGLPKLTVTQPDPELPLALTESGHSFVTASKSLPDVNTGLSHLPIVA
jgi:hypothetical protein